MAVPVAAMHKYDFLSARKNKIGFAREVGPMQPEAKAKLVRRATHNHFWLC
jgi:hypothetical protein